MIFTESKQCTKVYKQITFLKFELHYVYKNPQTGHFCSPNVIYYEINNGSHITSVSLGKYYKFKEQRTLSTY